jgi:ADP-ribose pyrophosphatase YjhB (NUDIX family)
MRSDFSIGMPNVILSGCAILKHGKILLIRKKGKEVWELPGGRADPHSLENVAARKTHEQIGVEPTIVQQFTVLEFQKDDTDVEATIFECDIDPDASLMSGENVDEVRWFALQELDDVNIGADVQQVIEELQ